MKTFVKIEGDPKEEALEALRKIAIDMPEVCIMDTGIRDSLGLDTALGAGPGGIPGAGGQGSLDSIEMIKNYFGGPSVISKERCQNIISDSNIDLGEYDFVYEWSKEPTSGQLVILEEQIGKELNRLGVKYSIKSE
jgi:hypothetical protein